MATECSPYEQKCHTMNHYKTNGSVCSDMTPLARAHTLCAVYLSINCKLGDFPLLLLECHHSIQCTMKVKVVLLIIIRITTNLPIESVSGGDNGAPDWRHNAFSCVSELAHTLRRGSHLPIEHLSNAHCPHLPLRDLRQCLHCLHWAPRVQPFV